ncbi:MAG: hypothetical protein HZA54_04480 [Planctomycetes bacterium]|nr:hypothetical protein [Planctomycetota bacterium]
MTITHPVFARAGSRLGALPARARRLATAAAAALLLALPLPAAADTILLKDGRKLEGKMTDQGTHVEMKTKDGVVRIDKKEIAEIEVSGTPGDGDAAAAAPGPQADAAGDKPPAGRPAPVSMGKVNELRDRLRAKEDGERIAAATEAGQLGAHALIPDLVKLLQGAPAAGLAAACRHALVRLDPKKTVPELAKALKPSPSAALLEAAIPLCAAARSKESAEVLGQIWMLKMGTASDQARAALLAMRGPALLMVAANLARLDMGNFDLVERRRPLIAFLKDCPSREKPVIAALTRNLSSTNFGCGLQAEAAEALVAIGSPTIPYLLPLLQNGDSMAAPKAQEVLTKLTGQTYHQRDMASWGKWFNANKKRLEDEDKVKAAEEKAKEDAAARAAEALRAGGAPAGAAPGGAGGGDAGK